MDNFSEDREYEERRQKRAERIARMRLEKQRQQRRLRMLKIILPVSLVTLVILIAVSGNGNEADENIQAGNISTQTQIEMNTLQTEVAEVVEVTEAPEVTKASVVYEFVENDATKGIYGEIISYAPFFATIVSVLASTKMAWELITSSL